MKINRKNNNKRGQIRNDILSNNNENIKIKKSEYSISSKSSQRNFDSFTKVNNTNDYSIIKKINSNSNLAQKNDIFKNLKQNMRTSKRTLEINNSTNQNSFNIERLIDNFMEKKLEKEKIEEIIVLVMQMKVLKIIIIKIIKKSKLE